jgi:hypothetical protein
MDGIDQEQTLDDEGNVGDAIVGGELRGRGKRVVDEEMVRDRETQRPRGERFELEDGAVQEIVGNDGGIVANGAAHRRLMCALGGHGFERERGRQQHRRDQKREQDQRAGTRSVEVDHCRRL